MSLLLDVYCEFDDDFFSALHSTGSLWSAYGFGIGLACDHDLLDWMATINSHNINTNSGTVINQSGTDASLELLLDFCL